MRQKTFLVCRCVVSGYEIWFLESFIYDYVLLGFEACQVLRRIT